MKTSALPEVEVLRAEVRSLRNSVADLEGRLAEIALETFEAEDENLWGIWPYCWIVAGWNKAEECFHSFHKNVAKQGLTWRNRRTQREAQREAQRAAEGQEFAGLRLT